MIMSRHASSNASDTRLRLRTIDAEMLLESRTPKVKAALELLERAARCDAPVVFQGEAGTGKHVLAHLLHARHRRHTKPLVEVGCHGVAEETQYRQLFGAAGRNRANGDSAEMLGAIERAAGGTLVLNDVGDLPAGMQTKLLRLVHDQRFVRYGESCSRRANVRLLVTTRRSLQREVDAGRFDPDLFFRLNVIEIQLPPLRERPDDILPLARHFLKFFADSGGRPVPTLSAEAEAVILNYDWPGNIGELRNAMEHVVAIEQPIVVQAHSLPEQLQRHKTTLPECGGNFTLEEVERRHVLAHWSRNAQARRSRPHAWYRHFDALAKAEEVRSIISRSG